MHRSYFSAKTLIQSDQSKRLCFLLKIDSTKPKRKSEMKTKTMKSICVFEMDSHFMESNMKTLTNSNKNGNSDTVTELSLWMVANIQFKLLMLHTLQAAYWTCSVGAMQSVSLAHLFCLVLLRHDFFSHWISEEYRCHCYLIRGRRKKSIYYELQMT